MPRDAVSRTANEKLVTITGFQPPPLLYYVCEREEGGYGGVFRTEAMLGG